MMAPYRMATAKIVADPDSDDPIDMGSFPFLLPTRIHKDPLLSLKGTIHLAGLVRNTDTSKIYNLSNKNRLKGSFCLSPEKSVNDINRIVKLAGMAKATACFVTAAPDEPFVTPVILLDDDSMEDFQTGAKLIFSVQEISTKAVEVTEGDLLGHPVEENAVDPESASAAESRGAELPVEEKSTWTSLLSGIGSVVTNVTNALSKSSLIKGPFEELLSSRADWLAEPDHTRYVKAMDLIASASSMDTDSGRFELITLSKSMENFFGRRNFEVDVLLLSCGAWLLRSMNEKKCDRARRDGYKKCLLKCMGAYDPLTYCGRRLCKIPLVGPQHPTIIINTYVSSTAKSWHLITGDRTVPDAILRNMLWLWAYQCNENGDAWLGLLHRANGTFFNSQCGILEKFMDRKLFNSLGLSLCYSFRSFRRLCMDLSGGEQRSILVFTNVSDKLVKLLDEDVNRSSELSRVMEDFIVVLRIIEFDRDDRDVRRNVIGVLVSRLSFRSRGTFNELNALFESLAVESPDHWMFRESIWSAVLGDINQNQSSREGVKMKDVETLLASKIGKALASPRGIDVFSRYMSRAMKSRAITKTKLNFLGDTYRYFVSEQWAPSPESFVEHIRQCLSEAISNRPAPFLSFLDTFEVALKDPGVFDAREAGDDLSHWLASEVVSTLEPPELIRSSGRFVALFDHCADASRAGPLLFALLQCTKERLAAASIGLEQALDLYMAFCMTKDSTSDHIIDIGRHVLLRAFEAWNPTSFHDLLALGHDQLRRTYESLLHCTGVNVCSGSADDLVSRIKKVVVTWVERFRAKDVSLYDTSCVVEQHDLVRWRFMNEMAETDLPDLDTMKRAIAEYQETVALLRRTLALANDDDESVISSQSIGSVLRGYGARPEHGSTLDRILCDYACLLGDKSKIPPTTSIDKTITLKSILDDAEYVSTLRKSRDTELLLAEYFLRTNSILFRDSIGFGSWDVLESEEFFEKLLRAKDVLEERYLITSTLEAVKRAASVVEMAGGRLEDELLILCDCPLLVTTQEGSDRIQAVAALTKVVRPLQQFASSCDQFKFGFARSDPTFARIRNVSTELGSDDVSGWTLGHALMVASNLVELLVSQVDDVQRAELSAASVKAELDVIMPTLLSFAELSRCSDVWTLVREMHWFGEEGLKRFYEEHENVTNVLLSDSASFEMSVLNSLEPTVRHLSLVGGLQNASCFREFFDSFHERGERGVLALLEDIRIVQQNVSNVKEWFVNGMDDMAAIYALFEQVYKTGQYIIKTSDSTTRSTMTSTESLCLRYTKLSSSNDEALDWLALEGQKLDEFIQQLGFIQHENAEVSDRVNEFVDKHRIVTKAVSNTIRMINLGFGGSEVQKFCCSVSHNDISDAKQMLVDSDEKYSQCSTWLVQVLCDNPFSRLFWMDELRNLYLQLGRLWNNTGGDWEEGVLDSIIRIAKRIIPPRHRRSSLALQGSAGAVIVEMGLEPDNGEPWIVKVSAFLVKWYKGMELPLPDHRDVSSEGRENIVVHNLDCDDSMKNRAMMNLLSNIYKGRLPADFEIFDAIIPSSVEMLVAFLDRVLAFPSCTFTILNAEALSGEQQEKVLSFLSRRDIASRGIRLNCVQFAGTILHTSPWVGGRSWDRTSLDALGGAQYPLPDDTFRCLVSEKATVSIVATQAPGTGKTRYIRQQLQIAKESGAQVGSINIHEGTSLSALIDSLSNDFFSLTNGKTVFFAISGVPSEGDIRSPWLAMLNHFFFSFLVLGSVYDPQSGASFHSGQGPWTVFVELSVPDIGEEALSPGDWLQRYIPILTRCGTITAPPSPLEIGSDTRRVCTYLRAYDDGTINRRFQPARSKRVVFLLDESGSMEYEIAGRRNALDVATDNALQIFDSHIQVDDRIGLITFSRRTRTRIWPSQQVADAEHKNSLRNQVNDARNGCWGGTCMYGALQIVLDTIETEPFDGDTWIVCLTDGASEDSSTLVRDRLSRSSNRLHLVVVGVNLAPKLQEEMTALCCKFGGVDRETNKGFFLSTEAQAQAMDDAFGQVASCIPVSQTFALDGALSDEDCRSLVRKHLPGFVAQEDKLLTTFWIRYLHRRVSVLDSNESFNYNETHDNLGSSLMETMLSEVEQFLDRNQNKSWTQESHRQLIYDFSNPDSPEFRLICTCPEALSNEIRTGYEQLDLPGFFIPSSQDLRRRSILDTYLSQALQIPLTEGQDGSTMLSCIDDNGFVLTLDFTLKLLSMHERVSCRIPCILEGETGVSKTALTKMYSILMNSSMHASAKKVTLRQLEGMETHLADGGASFERYTDEPSPCKRLELAIVEASEGTIAEETQIATELYELLKHSCECRGSMFRDPPSEYVQGDSSSNTTQVLKFLRWFASAAVEPTFFEINVHASLSECEVIERFSVIQAAAKKLADSESIVVVFLDEVNTSSTLGLFKEIVIDHSIAGDPLEANIVVISACNPPRRQATREGLIQREIDLGKDWASGHYQVSKLPESMEKLKWAYGSLNSEQEKDFVFRRLELLGRTGQCKVPPGLAGSMTELITVSQEAVRTFARDSICMRLKRLASVDTSLDEADARARSTVSLRDIQRVFNLFHFFSEEFVVCLRDEDLPVTTQSRRAMLLAIGVVYYLRLDEENRSKLLGLLQALPTEDHHSDGLLDILNDAMDNVIHSTEIPPGIALTRGLKENIFMTLICSLSRTPLMIVGPPGSSKTLSVNIVSDNANGVESPSPFYRKLSRISTFHYQCSKSSTSNEVASVFRKAIQRQRKVDSSAHKCLVFMDEAGLPEEERESLKVLHYFLEGHMSTKADVSFVAITNHVLDAAKSNRCVTLLRQEPDKEELLSIARGILFDANASGDHCIRRIQCDSITLRPDEFVNSLCKSYTYMLHNEEEFQWFELFFGLRDFVFFLKAMRANASMKEMVMELSICSLVWSFEQNFSGTNYGRKKDLAMYFLVPLLRYVDATDIVSLTALLSRPMELVRSALAREESELKYKARYKLIIDETDDDSILRLLRIDGVLRLSKRSLFKLSCMPEEVELEKSRLVSGVKYCALQGNAAVLSQTESVNESFYDLFNQNFRSLKDRSGKLSLFANIAVGGVSRRSLVRPSFQCIVHTRLSELDEVPAPFLNRFEKYRVSVSDVLESGWCDLGGGMEEIFRCSRASVIDLKDCLGASNLFGFVEGQTIDSIFLVILPSREAQASVPEAVPVLDLDHDAPETSYIRYCVSFADQHTSLKVRDSDVAHVVETAMKVLPVEDADVLHDLSVRTNMDCAVLSDAFQSVLDGDLSNSIARVTRIVLQMLVTRMASFQLILLATPEAVFAKRDTLPSEVVQEYFKQHHFSLRSTIQNRLRYSSGLLVVHTRTDASVRGIPTFSPSTQHASSEQIELVKELVGENLDNMILEHLLLLHSETAVRSTIERWLNLPNRNFLLLLVDMNDADAVNRVNFVRTMVEQHGPFGGEKSLVILLHYTQSGSHLDSRYPALFLGGWQHIFLDCVGGGGVRPEKWIEAACFSEYSAKLATYVQESIATLMPKALTYVATQSIFYPGQAAGSSQTSNFATGTFFEKYDALSWLMNRRAGSDTIGEILQRKFAAFWSDSNLVKMLKRSSESLLDGSSQLSMTLSLRSVFQESLGMFLSTVLIEMNQWRNLDILCNDYGTDATDELFGFIASALPVMPFEELILQRHVSGGIQSITSLAVLHGPPAVHFPFFYFVASYLDQIAEKAENLSSATVAGESPLGVSGSSLAETAVSETSLVETANGILYEERSDVTATLRTVRDIVSRVKNGLCTEKTSLYQSYLKQYVTWKLGCEPTDTGMMMNMISKKIPKGEAGNILAVHVIARANQVAFTRIASWSSGAIEFGSSTRLLELNGSGLDTELLRHEIFRKFLEQLDTRQSTLCLSSGLEYVQSILATSGICNDLLVSDLRQLSFLYIVSESNAPDEIKRGARNSWYNVEERLFRSRTSTLESFAMIFRELGASDTDAWYRAIIEKLFRHFFSQFWLEISKKRTCQKDDLRFLLKTIAEKRLLRSHQLAVVLLRRGLKVQYDDENSFLGFSGVSLELMTSEIKCDNLHVFADGSEQRVVIPHYIPSWLVAEVGQPVHGGMASGLRDDVTKTFFNEYSHSYHCYLSEVLFSVVLGEALAQAKNQSSEHILIALLQDMTNECTLKRSDSVRYHRLRSCSGKGTGLSPTGTAVGALITNARLLVYVAKVAFELATTSSCAALNGPYSALASEVLEATMSQRQCLWQEFFFSTIIRVRGEGNLLVLLGSEGTLNQYTWCLPWIEGLPSNVAGREREWKDAEDALAEAVQEEDRKARQLRHCPHCTRLFTVLENNCGQFVCGRDAHGDIGVDRVYGCGRGFAINDSRPYSPDDTILAPLRIVLAEKQSDMETSTANASRFDRLRETEIPVILFDNSEQGSESLAPSCNLLNKLETADNTSFLPWANLFRIITQESANLSRYSILPDLIELYMWIHSTFRFLVTKEQALHIEINQLMQKNILLRRFDPVTTDHVLAVWSRVREGFNPLLEKGGCRIVWDCENVVIPFKRIEDASLMMLLSELGHPTDGNDFLFLLIHSIVQEYNSFAHRLNDALLALIPLGDGVRSETPQAREQRHPKFLLRGSAGVLSTSTHFLREFTDGSGFLESFWCSELSGYEIDALRDTLAEGLLPTKTFPTISSPTSFLRERFQFRDDTSMPEISDSSELAARSKDGLYFVHAQDLQLYESAKGNLSDLGSKSSDDAIRHAIRVNFYDSDYSYLRSMLEGIRTASSQCAEPQRLDDKTTFGAIIRHAGTPQSGDVLSDDLILRGMGFPLMKDTQWQLLQEMSICESHHLIKFLGYQLASEGYLFSTLPLRMAEPIPNHVTEEMNTLLEHYYKREGVSLSLDALNEFVNSCISFYEREICHASAESRSLKVFLEENSFGDSDSFPFFEVIPASVTIRHYVSLRQYLNQTKLHLSIMMTTEEEGPRISDDSDKHSGPNLSKVQRGFCWLWAGSQESQKAYAEDSVDENERLIAGMKQINRLWFDALPKEKKRSGNDQGEESPQEDGIEGNAPPVVPSAIGSDVQIKAASLIQITWRKRRELGEYSEKVHHVSRSAAIKQKAQEIVGSSEAGSGNKSRRRRPDSCWVRILLLPCLAVVICIVVYWHRSSLPLISNGPGSRKHGDANDTTCTDEMNDWLPKHQLPASLCDSLVVLGARHVGDIMLIVNNYPEMLDGLPPLDKIKLVRAIQQEMEPDDDSFWDDNDSKLEL